jgi:hypothetical protein
MKGKKVVPMVFFLILAFVLFSLRGSAADQSVSTIRNYGSILYSVVPDTLSTPINKATFIGNESSLSASETTYIANRFDFLMVPPYMDVPSLQQLKAKNPNMTVLAYRDIIGHGQVDRDWATINQHEDWFVHDNSGNRIMENKWGWLLMNITNVGYQQRYVSYVNSQIDNSGFDGVFADDCWNDFRTYYNWNTSLSNIPSDFVNNLHNSMNVFLQYVKANILPGKIVVVNTDEWRTHDYLDIADGKMDEGFAHPSWESFSGYDARNMPQLLDSIARDSATGKIVWCFSGMTIPENPDQTILSQVASVSEYCYSAFLLGLNGSKACLQMNQYDSSDGSNGCYPIMDTNLGTPIGSYYESQNIYERDFSLGKVLLNPSSNPYFVNLGSTYRFSNGTQVSNLTIAAQTGEILLKLG